MKIAIFGKDTSSLLPLLKKYGFKIVKKNPQMVISHGGDGTMIKVDRAWPNIPKIVLRNSLICKKCSPFSNEEVLQKIQAGKYKIEPLMRLAVTVGRQTLQSINDIIIHNHDPRGALRYTVTVDKRPPTRTIIGDGVVAATPYGSTGYYRSITDSLFEVGIGVAFNNSTEQADHMVLKDTSIIKIKIIRGPASVFADNNPKEFIAQEGDEIVIRKSPKSSSVVTVF